MKEIKGEKIENLLLEICTMIESGSIIVGPLGLSEDSVKYAIKLYNRIKLNKLQKSDEMDQRRD